jgi:hypothetical protein
LGRAAKKNETTNPLILKRLFVFRLRRRKFKSPSSVIVTAHQNLKTKQKISFTAPPMQKNAVSDFIFPTRHCNRYVIGGRAAKSFKIDVGEAN